MSNKGMLEQIQPAIIMMPGIGSQGGSIDIAFGAAKGHRPFAIIGSALYGNSDPGRALEQYVREIRG